MAKYFRWFGLKGELVLTLLLSSLALVLALVFRTPERFTCLAAMLFCTGGDLVIVNFHGIRKYIKHLLPAGAALFAIGHIFYLITYGMHLLRAGYTLGTVNGGFYIAISLVTAGMIGGSIFCIRYKRKRMIPLILIYGAVLGANACTIISYAWAAVPVRPIAVLAGIGAVVFLISDFGVAIERLDRRHDWHSFVWWTYPIAQMLLILGA